MEDTNQKDSDMENNNTNDSNTRDSNTENNNSNKSLCVNICVLDDEGFCVGCDRSVEEITGWSSMTDEEKEEVLENIEERKLEEE